MMGRAADLPGSPRTFTQLSSSPSGRIPLLPPHKHSHSTPINDSGANYIHAYTRTCTYAHTHTKHLSPKHASIQTNHQPTQTTLPHTQTNHLPQTQIQNKHQPTQSTLLPFTSATNTATTAACTNHLSSTQNHQLPPTNTNQPPVNRLNHLFLNNFTVNSPPS